MVKVVLGSTRVTTKSYHPRWPRWPLWPWTPHFASLASPQTWPKQVLRCLIRRGAALNSRSHNQETSLMAAVQQGQDEAVDALIEAGAALFLSALENPEDRNLGKCLNGIQWGHLTSCFFDYQRLLLFLTRWRSPHWWFFLVPPCWSDASMLWKRDIFGLSGNEVIAGKPSICHEKRFKLTICTLEYALFCATPYVNFRDVRQKWES